MLLCVKKAKRQTDQVQFRGVRQQLDVGATTVDARLEVHLIPEHTRDDEEATQLAENLDKEARSYCTIRGLVSKVKGRSSLAEMA